MDIPVPLLKSTLTKRNKIKYRKISSFDCGITQQDGQRSQTRQDRFVVNLINHDDDAAVNDLSGGQKFSYRLEPHNVQHFG